MSQLEPVERQVGTGQYVSRLTQLRNSKRVDVEVDHAPGVEAFDDQFLAALRQFFDRFDAEAHKYRGDPVALTHALARVETLLADVRYVRDTVRRLDAEALSAARIRRLTVTEVATVEGTSSVERSNWEHRRLMLAMLQGFVVLDAETGERLNLETFADIVLHWLTPSWKLTAIRERGYDPDTFCDVAMDDEGRPQRTPAVKMVDNTVRKIR